MNFLLYNIIFKHNSSTFNIISNINILVLYWIVIFFKLFFNPILHCKKQIDALLFFSFFVQHQKSEFRHKQINLLQPSAYIIFADMKETSALIDKACRNLNIDSLNGMQKQMLETATRPNDIILLLTHRLGKNISIPSARTVSNLPQNCRSASARHRSLPRARFTNRQRIA